MSLSVPDLNVRIVAPALIVAVTALAVLLGELATPPGRKQLLGYLSLLGLALAAAAAVSLWGANTYAFRGMMVADSLGLFLTLVILAGGALCVLLSVDFVRVLKIDQGEYYVLLLASVTGMIVMATAADLITIFLGLELLSLPLYILAAFQREAPRSLEAGMKYFLLGAFSSAFFLYGIALVYGSTGTTSLARLGEALVQNGHAGTLLLMGLGLLLVGYAFKVAVVPFHWWTPDVYEGAPTAVTAFMSVAVKAAAFGALFRTFLALPLPAAGAAILPGSTVDWRSVLAALAVLTMTLGNVAALLQSNIKRMLAYSSIAHAGYILIALVVLSPRGTSAALFYLLAYTLTNVGAFGAVIALGDGARERLNLPEFAGAARSQPLAAAALSICLLSLAGFPPLAGFVGKFLIFGAAVEGGWTWLAVVGVLNSLVSVYFYLRPIVQMYMHEPSPDWDLPVGRGAPRAALAAPLAAAIVIAVAGVVLLGLFPAPAMAFAQIAFVR